jgi:hypothetical protein
VVPCWAIGTSVRAIAGRHHDFRLPILEHQVAWVSRTCRSPKLDRGLSEPHSLAVFSVNVVDQRFIAQINHHGMVGQRDEIEQDFIAWHSPASIAKHYGLQNRSTVYRHAHAVGLFPKRQRNVRAALEKIIERAGEVDATAPAVVAAVQAYAKINAAGQWVDRSEHVDLNALFEKMTVQELEAYAQNGTLPLWFTATVGATADNGQKE